MCADLPSGAQHTPVAAGSRLQLLQLQTVQCLSTSQGSYPIRAEARCLPKHNNEGQHVHPVELVREVATLQGTSIQ